MATDANDHSFTEAVAAAIPRWTALSHQIAAAWQAIEPSIRAWIADADTLTEQQWMDESEGARTFYDTWKAWLAEHDK